jgi:cytoskeletal protein CcmA (bactofilin family)
MSMFNKKDEAPQSFSMQVINNIGSGTIIEGNIRTEGDIRIDGKVVGNIVSKGRLVTGPNSEIIGDLICVNGNIDGKVKGNIQVTETLRITKTASIDGNISVKKLIVDEGAMIQAKIAMSNNPTIANTADNSPQQKQQQHNPNQR